MSGVGANRWRVSAASSASGVLDVHGMLLSARRELGHTSDTVKEAFTAGSSLYGKRAKRRGTKGRHGSDETSRNAARAASVTTREVAVSPVWLRWQHRVGRVGVIVRAANQRSCLIASLFV